MRAKKDEKSGEWIDIGDVEAWQFVARILRSECDDEKDLGAYQHKDSETVSTLVGTSASWLSIAGVAVDLIPGTLALESARTYR